MRPKLSFESRVIPEPNSGCWLWAGGHDQDGYGHMTGNVKAHRRSYELHVGPIPMGVLVCHKCDTPCCVNPDHLFLGSGKDNGQDMSLKGRGACGRKHWKAVLTEADVIAIRADTISSHAALAKLYPVTAESISHIRNGRTWKHVNPDPTWFEVKRELRKAA